MLLNISVFVGIIRRKVKENPFCRLFILVEKGFAKKTTNALAKVHENETIKRNLVISTAIHKQLKYTIFGEH